MKEKETDKVIAFDTLFTTNRIQMYKILLSYLPPADQKKLAIYIKFMELQYTISFFKNHPHAAFKGLPHENSMNANHFFDEVEPFCDMSQRENLNRIRSLLQNFENMQEMMETIQMMKELFPEGMGNGEGNTAGNGMDMTQLLNMLGSSDMSGILNMFSGFSSSNSEAPETP